MRISFILIAARWRLLGFAAFMLCCSGVFAQTASPVQSLPTTKPTLPSAEHHPEPVGDPTIAAARTGDGAVAFKQNHQRLLQRTKVGNIDLLFLGDSITQFWDRYPEAWKKAFGDYKAANYGVAGDRVENLLWRIENGELDGLSPKVIVLMIGTNNTGINSADQIATGISHVVLTIRGKCPNAKVIVLSILPRSREGEEAKSDAIRQINSSLAKLDDGMAIKYLDLTPKFVSPEGKPQKDLMNDGFHPNGKGYDLWGDAMETMLEEMMK